MRTTIKLLAFVSAIAPSLVFAAVCPTWSAPEKVGSLDTKIIMEASGLAQSRQFTDRLYHINDSGDGPFYYTTDLKGANTRKVTVPEMEPKDVEDVTVGPCPGKANGESCLFLADIGDNARARSQIEIWILPETSTIPEQSLVWKKLVLRYPDNAHDAESIAVNPMTGDLLLLTKEADYQIERRAAPGMLFSVSAQAMAAAGPENVLVLQKLGSIDLPWINYDYGLFGQIATAMDIRPDGSRLLVLTYENAVEISMDKILGGAIDTRTWKEGADYGVVRWPLLNSQQEAVTYAADGNSFLFDSEFNPGDTEAALYRISCETP